MSLVRKVTIDGGKKRKLSRSTSRSSEGRRGTVSVPRLAMKGVHRFNRYSAPIYLGFNNVNGFSRGATVEGSTLGFYWNLVAGTHLIGAVNNTYALPDATDFSNLFDRYRIKSVEMTIIHCTDSTAGVVSAGAPMLPTYYIYPDYNTSGVTTVAEALCREGLVIWKPSSDKAIFKKKFFPRLNTLEGAAGTGAPEMPVGTFIPTTSTGRYHGVRIATDAMNQVTSAVITPLTIHFKYEIELKSYQ